MFFYSDTLFGTVSTFQFGVFKFPYEVNNSDFLYFQPVATKNNDLSLMTLHY